MLRLRVMRETDLDAVMRIERASHALPWPRTFFRHGVRSGWVCRVLAGERGVVGYGVARIDGAAAHITNLTIAPACRGRGLGRRMLLYLQREAWRRGATQAHLEVRPSNHHALRLYRALGFRRMGTRQHYYPRPRGGENALVMTRSAPVPAQPARVRRSTLRSR